MKRLWIGLMAVAGCWPADASAFADLPFCATAVYDYDVIVIDEFARVGLVQGYDGDLAGLFLPQSEISRDHFRLITLRVIDWLAAHDILTVDEVLADPSLARLLSGPRFSDVPADHWAFSAVDQLSMPMALDAPLRRGNDGLTNAEGLAVAKRLYDLRRPLTTERQMQLEPTPLTSPASDLARLRQILRPDLERPPTEPVALEAPLLRSGAVMLLNAVIVYSGADLVP